MSRIDNSLHRLHSIAPTIVRVSLAIVVVVGLGAPFFLEPQQALWVAPALVLAALGGWVGWRAYASVAVVAQNAQDGGATKAAAPSNPCSSPATHAKTIVASNWYLLMTRASSMTNAVPLASSLAPGAGLVASFTSSARES